MTTTEKLTLEYIAPYLSHKLKVLHTEIDSTGGSDTQIVTLSTAGEECLTFTDDFQGASDYHFGCDENPEIKLLLRRMDLTKPIIVEGKEIIPILELANLYQKQDWELTHDGFAINEDLSEEFGIRHGCFSVMDTTYDLLSLNQLPLFQWLFKHKFDVFNLIPAGLAIDVNTLETNPYN